MKVEQEHNQHDDIELTAEGAQANFDDDMGAKVATLLAQYEMSPKSNWFAETLRIDIKNRCMYQRKMGLLEGVNERKLKRSMRTSKMIAVAKHPDNNCRLFHHGNMVFASDDGINLIAVPARENPMELFAFFNQRKEALANLLYDPNEEDANEKEEA